MHIYPYWWDENYLADLDRYARHVGEVTGCPNLYNFLCAQSKEETGYGHMFTSINNYANMGAVDANPQAAPRYPTPESGGDGWLRFLGWGNPRSTYHQFELAARQGVSDVLQLAQLIKAGGWATDPNYPAHVASKA